MILGKIIVTKFIKNNNKNTIEYGILGIISASFIALIINFFLPLNILVNSITYLLLILIFVFQKIKISKQDFFFITLTSFVCFLLILFDTEYRPDAGLYHFPYIQILNESKIVIGLSNLHSRFGHISIIQYLAALNYNVFTGLNGILIPLASLISFIYIYFFYDIFKYLKKRENFSLGKVFSLAILIYLSYKINRYSEFGNDAPAHLFSFYLISAFIYTQNNSLKNTNLIYIYSVFAFINKVFLIFIFIIPFSMFLSEKKNFIKLLFSFPTFFLLLWLIKNILISGCFVYPLKNTCLTNLKWTDIDTIQRNQIEAEAWSKGWPQNKNSNLSIEEFSKNFNWLTAWSSVHLKYIIKILSPYVLLILTIFIFLNLKSNSKISKNDKIIINFKNHKFITLSIISFIGILSFIFQSPIYRYGYSYIILFIFLIFIRIFYRINIINFFKICKVFFIICVFVIFSKQVLRIYNKAQERNFIPSYVFIDKNEIEKKYQKFTLIDNFNVYLSNTECFYGKAPCTNYKQNISIIKADKKNSFYILYN